MKNENDLKVAIYCTNCKHKLNPNNVFCSYCGNIVTNNVKSENNNMITKDKSIDYPDNNNNNNIDLKDTIYCINCNHKINKNYRYCSYCGNYVATNIKSNNIITHNNDINHKNSDDDKNISIISLLIFFFIFLPQIFVYIYAFSNSTGAADGTGFVVMFSAVFSAIPTIVSFYLGVIAVKRYNFIVKKRVVSDVRKKLNFFNIISLFLMAPFVFIYLLLFIIIFMCSFIF